MPNGEANAEYEKIWSDLEEKVCEQIKAIDREIDNLYRDRDRLQNFLNDHKRKRC